MKARREEEEEERRKKGEEESLGEEMVGGGRLRCVTGVRLIAARYGPSNCQIAPGYSIMFCLYLCLCLSTCLFQGLAHLPLMVFLLSFLLSPFSLLISVRYHGWLHSITS